MSSLLRGVYGHSPVWIQNLGISFYGLVLQHRRFRGIFSEFVEKYYKHEAYSKDEWLKYQSIQLREILSLSAAFVPYYRKILQTIPGYPEFRNFNINDLSLIPILHKEDLRKNPKSFLSENINTRSIYYFHTSGTTGTPLAIAVTNEFNRKWSAAYETRVRNWAGVNRKMSRATFGGRVIVPRANATPPFWRFNIIGHQLYMSAYHITPENSKYYVAALNKYRPDYLVGYASSHFYLARMVVEQNLSVHSPRAILTSAEKLTDEMRQTLQEAYKTPVFDAYSGVEGCCLASECEHHSLHISPDVGIVELVNENGRPVMPGEVGYIVATGLLNKTQPLIRYWTGDLAMLDEVDCKCGRQMPVLKDLVGRLEDTIIGQDGREIRRIRFTESLHHIRESQLVQKSLTEFQLRLVTDSEFNDNDRLEIIKRFEERLGSINLTFEYVSQIERTENGKFRAVISHVRRQPVLSSK